jgi:hypothetical protein
MYWGAVYALSERGIIQGTFRNGARGEEGGKVGRQLEPTFSIPHDVLTDLGCISNEKIVLTSEQVDFNLESSSRHISQTVQTFFTIFISLSSKASTRYRS